VDIKKRYADLLADALERVQEIMPWYLRDLLAQQVSPLVLDVRGRPNLPRRTYRARSRATRRARGGLQWDYERHRCPRWRAADRRVVVVCRSAIRSVLAADVMQQMGLPMSFH